MTIFFLLFLCLPATASEQQKLTKLMDNIWQYELSISPVYASSQGVHDFDDQLADISPEGLARQNDQFESFLHKLDNINQEQLPRTDQINLLMQRYRIQNYVDEYHFKAHYVPLTSEYGFHSAMAGLPRSSRFANVKDYQNYLTRLDQIPAYFAQQIAWMKKGMEVGMVQPKAVMLGFEKSVESFFSGKVEDNTFYSPFLKIDDSNATEAQKRALIIEAKEVIKRDVMGAYQSFYDFLVTDYIPNAKSDVASKTWPNGEKMYQNRAQYYTTTDLSVDDIHQLGLTEVARIRAQMQDIVDELDFQGSINEFIEFLRTDPQFYAKTPEELLKHASYVAKRMDAKLPKLFYKLPRTPYGVAPVPDAIAPKYTTGRYVSPRRDDEPGYYWVNTYALDKRPLYAIPALTMHEAVPGHHLQISLASEMQNLPNVRRYTYISAFGEGWGLYSEFLGKEVGIYQTPYEEFGRLSYEMWRACRLVVDTGMHMKGWTRQQALDYMLENTALSEHNVTTEIDRYISWPAQALAYKIGELEIKKLRAEAEEALGDKFDLRAFHDAVLEYGSIPLSVLRENIALFIEQQKAL
ncbi:DUF885 domain-containing protein [Aliiglaciecola sp. 3_MG-2023]|uniref:DUF885 domain-containing protein n=1 Tax=Aliiglaciecola sp. 3_MG-2023 TaxID=3062644 RepID=UPI0026E1C660|nr:DUF885 domain-containing protein [Aliiglaciecola sp. 3_MG-2023]MDO6692985.1 DUF885 domain-containing protein [Aliiglaciecola sp. 3_MG-2023]